MSGQLVYGAPLGPDQSQGLRVVAGTFLLFLAYLASLLCWGAWCIRKREVSLWESLFWGSALFALLPATLGFLPWLGIAPFWNAILLLGFGLAWRLSAPRVSLALSPWLMAVAGTFLAAQIALASIPHPFWDSLWYHLTAPRIWWEVGYVHLPAYFPPAYQAGLWDYHFLWGHILLAGTEAGGLIAAQLFGQWLNQFFLLASLCALWEMRGKLEISATAIFLGVLGTELLAVSAFAKSDWGIVFWGICFLGFFLQGRNAWLLGFSAGLCFSAKYTAGFFLLPFFVLFLWRTPRRSWQLGLGFLVAALPVVWRNFVGTGNPLFPAFSTIFPNILGPSWDALRVYQGFTLGGQGIAHKVFRLLSDSWALWFLPLFPFVRKKFPLESQRILACALVSLLLFLFFTGNVEWRYLGAGLVVAAIFGAGALEKTLPYPAITLVLAGIFFWFGQSLPPLQHLFEDRAISFRRGAVGPALAWVRMEVPVGTGVATLQDQRIYPLFAHRPIRAFDVPDLDRALHAAKDGAEAVSALRKKGIRFVVLSAEFLDLYYRREVCDWLFALSEKQPQSIAFNGGLSRVIDLEKLR